MVHSCLSEFYLQASGIARDLRPFAHASSFFFWSTTFNLAAGAAIVTHLVEEVRTQGLGDGVSLFIFVPMLLSKQNIAENALPTGHSNPLT